MASMVATLRAILELLPDTDEPANCSLDTAELPDPLPALAGYTVSRVEHIALGAAIADQALSFVAPIAVILVSDVAFKLRSKIGESLHNNLRFFVLWADDVRDAVSPNTSVLLTGNGSTIAHITAYIVEKP